MDAFVTSLQSAGFQADAHTLRSVGNPDMGVADDESYMRSIMNPLIEAGQDVLLIVHSFAGFPGCSAISGIDKRGREARGEKGGVLGVIYLAAFVPMDGDSVYKLLRDNWEPWMEVNVCAWSHVHLSQRTVALHTDLDTFRSHLDLTPETGTRKTH